jgi:hypothetical protein
MTSSRDTDLRRKAPLQSWGTAESIRGQYQEGKSLRSMAVHFGINRRSVQKIALAAAQEKLHSLFQGVVGAALVRLKRYPVEKIMKEITYNPTTNSDYCYDLAYRRDHFYRETEGQRISDCPLPATAKGRMSEAVSPEKFLERRVTPVHLNRLPANEAVFKLLFLGILSDPKNFLRNNLPIFETAIALHLNKNPAHVWREIIFCFWMVFGHAGVALLGQVNFERFRWHVYKMRRRLATAETLAREGLDQSPAHLDFGQALSGEDALPQAGMSEDLGDPLPGQREPLEAGEEGLLR